MDTCAASGVWDGARTLLQGVHFAAIVYVVRESTIQRKERRIAMKEDYDWYDTFVRGDLNIDKIVQKKYKT